METICTRHVYCVNKNYVVLCVYVATNYVKNDYMAQPFCVLCAFFALCVQKMATKDLEEGAKLHKDLNAL